MKGFADLVHYVTIADKEARFMLLYINQPIDPIDSEAQVPDNRVTFLKIICIPRGACLAMQTGTNSNGKKKTQEEIWESVKFESKLSPSHISGIIGGDLQILGVSFWFKRVQEVSTRSAFFASLVSS